MHQPSPLEKAAAKSSFIPGIYSGVYNISALTRNAKSARFQDHLTTEGLVEASMLFGLFISPTVK